MKLKWKMLACILTWIALAALIHWTRINSQIEHPDWGDTSKSLYQIPLAEKVWLVGGSLSLPGAYISCYWPIRHGVPMFEEILPVAEISNDIFYALLIGIIIWKFSFKPKKL